MNGRLAALASATAWLLVAGLAVGLISGHWAAGSGASACPGGASGLPCLELTRSLAVRVGLFSGAMTMVVVMTWAGLLRMTAQDERRRSTLAREAAGHERAA